LGQSLGIDPVPMKTCNWNCVYCQLGRTSPLNNQRQLHAPIDAIVKEVQDAVAAGGDGGIDWLTIVGSGEPTLHAGLGNLIEQLKSLTTIPVAVLTNGSLLHLPDVRAYVSKADAVLPSLDAGSETLYRRINRSVPELSWSRLVEGLVAFRAEYAGRLWVEVMLIQGMNDTDTALSDLAGTLRRIAPDEVHIVLPVRPPTEPWVEVADGQRVARAAEIFGEVSRVVQPTSSPLRLSDCDDVIDAVAAVISRHPMSEADLVRSLAKWNPDQVNAALTDLQTSGKADVVMRHGERFWSGAEARYVE